VDLLIELFWEVIDNSPRHHCPSHRHTFVIFKWYGTEEGSGISLVFFALLRGGISQAIVLCPAGKIGGKIVW